jgi:hypothetical protein
MDEELEAYGQESRNFNASSKTTPGNEPPPDPTTREGL